MTAGTRAYSRLPGRPFYANGWHITGEMGGIWAPPVKLVDGLWFGVDDQWAGPATKFTSGRGYTRYDLPTPPVCSCLAPTSRTTAAAHSTGSITAIRADAYSSTVKGGDRSELMGPYPWGFTVVTPNAATTGRRRRLRGRPAALHRPGPCPGGEPTTTLRRSERRHTAGGRSGARTGARSRGKDAVGTDQVAPDQSRSP